MKNLLAICSTGIGYRTVTVTTVNGWRKDQDRSYYMKKAPDASNVAWFLTQADSRRNVCIYPQSHSLFAGELTASDETPLYTNGQATVCMLVAEGIVIWGSKNSFYTQFVGQSFFPPVDSFMDGRSVAELIQRYAEPTNQLCPA